MWVGVYGGVVSFSLKYIICIVNIFGDLIINKARLVVNIEKTNTFCVIKLYNITSVDLNAFLHVSF